ncbi:MAG: transposase [Bdellovibrionales bacterium]|nr:transposase [Bdellovibrionales bacterium]
MPRKPLIRSTVAAYHVTARVNNREAFPCALDQAWRELTHQCFEVTVLFEAKIHAFVMMPNHIHMLISTPREDLGSIMQHFMRSATRMVNRISNRSGHLFGSRYHWTLIDSPIYFAHALKYVYRNPVRAGLCTTVEGYPYSTLWGLMGNGVLPFPLFQPYGNHLNAWVPEDPCLLTHWLNRPFASEGDEGTIRRALRKHTFALPKQGWKRTPMRIIDSFDAASSIWESDPAGPRPALGARQPP